MLKLNNRNEAVYVPCQAQATAMYSTTGQLTSYREPISSHLAASLAQPKTDTPVMGKFIKPNKVVVILSGRYAGKKAVIVKSKYNTRDAEYYFVRRWMKI